MAGNEQLQSIIRDYTQQHCEEPDASADRTRPGLFVGCENHTH